MHETRLQGPGNDSARRDLVVLGAIMVGLSSLILLSQSGIMGFMHSLEEGNVLSIVVLVSLIAIIFVFLHKLGISLVYIEEIESQKA